jgi:hypothetical protein
MKLLFALRLTGQGGNFLGCGRQRFVLSPPYWSLNG